MGNGGPMKFFENSSMSLLNKIITYFVGYMILIMFLFSVMIYIVNYNGIKHINNSYSVDVTKLEAEMVRSWIDDTRTKLEDTALLIADRQGDIMTSIEGLKELQQKNKKLFRHLYIVNKDLAYIDTFGQESNMKDEMVNELLTGDREFVITNPEMHPVFSEALFNMIVPIKRDNQIIGVLGATITMNDISSRLERFVVAQSGFGWLLDENFTVIAHPEEDYILEMSILDKKQLDSLGLSGLETSSKLGFKGLEGNLSVFEDKNQSIISYEDPNGYHRTVSIVPLHNDNNWYVAFTTFDDKIPTTTNSLLFYMAIGLLVIVTASAFASYLLANEITKPINQLIHVVNLFIGGNKGVRAKMDSNDEFGSLGKAFNGMADTIIEHTDNVEELIQERTQMLADLNYQIVVRNKELNTMNEELESTNSKLHNLATTDMLTGLYNRHELVRSLQGFMDEVLKGDDPGFSVLFVDLDNFKYYNDTFSHEIGDFLLIEISKILKDNIRDNDVVARYGGDEFVILLKHGNFESSKMISERIHEKILEQKGFKKFIERKIGSEIKFLGKNMLSCSIGIVNYNRNVNAKNVEELLALADDTMYKAKKQGKSRIVVN